MFGRSWCLEAKKKGLFSEFRGENMTEYCTEAVNLFQFPPICRFLIDYVLHYTIVYFGRDPTVSLSLLHVALDSIELR